MTTTLWRFAVILLLATVLFGAGIGRYDLWPPDEPRYAQVAREMLERGDFLTPHVNGQPYYEKPPLLFWLIAVCSVPFGDVTEVSARAPSVATGVATVAFTFLLAEAMFGARTAIWAALILMTCMRGWWQARTGQIDMLLTACMTAGFYALWRFEDDRRHRWLVLLYGASAAGTLAKGPVALVFPMLFLAAFYWRNREGRRATHWVLGAIAVIAVVALWYVPARLYAAETAGQAVAAGMGGNLFRNIIGRLFLGVSKAQPPWYYLTTIPVDLLPWTLVLPWTLPWFWKRRGSSRAMWFLWCGIVPALIFFSISVGKRAVYILPLFPLFAIVIAASLDDLADAARAVWRRRTALVWGLLLALLGIAPFALRLTEYGHLASPTLNLFGGLVLALGSLVILLALLTDMKVLPSAFAWPFAAILLAAPWTVLPAVNSLKSAKDICAPVRTLAERGAKLRLYSVGFSREEYIFYSHHPHEEVFTSLVGDVPADLAALLDVAETQKRARKLIAEAVEDVPIADLDNVTPDERQALRAAIEGAIAGSDEDVQTLRTFEKDLIAEVDAFAATFSSPEPAFMFVQEQDWRWLLPLFTVVPEYRVIHGEGVGRREVLLLANGAGESLAAQDHVSQACHDDRACDRIISFAADEKPISLISAERSTGARLFLSRYIGRSNVASGV